MYPVYLIVNKSEPKYLFSWDKEGPECEILLREYYPNTQNEFFCKMKGDMARRKFRKGDYVFAKLKFMVRVDIDGNYFQEILIENIE